MEEGLEKGRADEGVRFRARITLTFRTPHDAIVAGFYARSKSASRLPLALAQRLP